MELLHKLGIDWKLLIAQLVNFFILLVILAKFVYRPVLDMLDKRSRTIEKGMHDAKAAQERLEQIEKLRVEKMNETAREISAMLEKSKSEAEAMKQSILHTAQTQAEDLLRRAKAEMAEAKEKMVQDAKREVAALIVSAAGKLMEREFSAADQKRLADAVAKEVQSL